MNVSNLNSSGNYYDAVLIGGGLMSSTLAVLLNELDPALRLLMVERLELPALESSAAVNNAGTGHAANCELNYTPISPDRKINPQKALEINHAFEQSLEFWASLSEMGKISPKKFLNLVPHISFVWGQSDVDFLKERFKKLTEFVAFSEMEWSNDFRELADWMPLVMDGRAFGQPIAATRMNRGTDIDFGALTNEYLHSLQLSGGLQLKLSTEVLDLKKDSQGNWQIELKDKYSINYVCSPFVFLGAGGGALSLLQKSGIPESFDYGGFPVSGLF